MPQLRDIKVVGISADAPDKQAKWDEKHNLDFPLLSDPSHKVAKKYGVFGLKKLYGREYEGVTRSMFLISPTGRIENSWMKIAPASSAPELLAALEKLDE